MNFEKKILENGEKNENYVDLLDEDLEIVRSKQTSAYNSIVSKFGTFSGAEFIAVHANINNHKFFKKN